jgi:putative flippase GtrA
MTRWTRFARVGMMGFVVQLVALQALSMLAGLHYTLAVVLAVEAAIVHNFVWHERWTWRDRPAASRGARVDRLVRFNLASGAVSLAGNVVFTMIFVELAGLPVLVANVAGITSLTAINFLVADRLTFVSAGEGNPGRLESRSAAAQTACCRPTALGVATLCLLAGMGAQMHAVPLEAETVATWERYVAEVEGRLAREVRATRGFLTADFAAPREQEGLRASLGRGEIPMEDVAGGAIDVGAGTISHWRGYVFVPGVTVDALLDGVALVGPQTAHEQEDVLESRVLGRDGDSLRLFLKLQRKALVTVAYNTEHLVTYEHRGSGRATSRSVSTRIVELEHAGTPAEREKPAGQDRGFLWRLHSYWRYQEVPGGVIVELESLTLSRDVPWALRPVASPIIDRIARESMTRTLSVLRARWSART